MDLLLQAAKVLEENSGIASDRTAGRSTRGYGFHSSPKGKGDAKAERRNRTFSGSSASLDDTVSTAEDDSGLAGEKRRAGGAGTREVHNQLEKNRRKQMRECFNQLQQCIPSLENKRVATHSILQGAIKHIKNLKKKYVEQEREIQTLAKRKSEFKKKYDVEFNKCSPDQQRKATEVMMKMERMDNHEGLGYDDEQDEDEEGNASDSTSTASEGPGNEENFSDEEKSGDFGDKPHVSRVNPIVAAKLDGFRKRKLATLDIYPKSTEFIIASMNDAGFLSGTSSKQKPASLSAVSSSSVALKNMLEQKKKQQTSFSPSSVSGPQPSVPIHQPKPKVPASSAKVPLSKGGSSLTSSHPMISNQLAAATSIPMVVSTASLLANAAAADSSDRLAFAPYAINTPAGSNFSPMKSQTPAVLSLTSLQNQLQVVDTDKSRQPMLLNSSLSAGNSIASTVLSRSTIVAPDVISNSQLQQQQQQHSRKRSSSLTLTSDASDSKMRASFSNTGIKSPPVIARTVNVFLENSNSSAGTMASLSNHTSSLSTTSTILAPQQTLVSPVSSAKVVPAVYPLSLIQGIALNHHGIAAPPTGATAVASSVVVPQTNGTLMSSVSVPGGGPLISAVSPAILQQPTKLIHPPEILITSPVKTMDPPAFPVASGANNTTNNNNPHHAGRVTTFLAAAAASQQQPTAATLTAAVANPNQPGGIIKSGHPTNLKNFVGSLPIVVTNASALPVSSPPSILAANPSGGSVTLAPEGLKTVTLTPTLLPFTVTPAGHLQSNSAGAAAAPPISHGGAPLRLFTPLNPHPPNSMVPAAAPLSLSNGPASLVPAVVQLDSSGQVTVLQNFVQLQTATQMLGQPVVVVTSPPSNALMATSATTTPLSVSSSSSPTPPRGLANIGASHALSSSSSSLSSSPSASQL